MERDNAVVEVVPLDELAKRVSSKLYVPVPRSQIAESASGTSLRCSGDITENLSPEARYSATLNATRLDQAKLEFETYPEPDSAAPGPLLPAGQTSLQQLKIHDEQGSIELGSDSNRRLFLLKSGVPGKLTGTWTSDGLVRDVVTFRLELPAATTSRLELLTKPDIVISSASSLILGPITVPATAETTELKSWTILPGEKQRV